MNVSNRVAVILLLIGMMILGVAEIFYSPVRAAPEEIDKSMLGERIRTEGKIEDVVKLDKVIFLKLEENPDLKVVKFTSDVGVEKGDAAVLEGEVDLYQGDIEIKVDEVRKKGSRQLSSGL